MSNRVMNNYSDTLLEDFKFGRWIWEGSVNRQKWKDKNHRIFGCHL